VSNSDETEMSLNWWRRNESRDDNVG